MNGERKATERLVLVGGFYVLSGALGLIYEVVFSKYLGYIFGATAYASSAVLVAFMGGLAVGAMVAGRLEKRIERPLFVYGWAELAIGCFCLIAPSLFGGLTAYYVDLAPRAKGSVVLLSVVRALFAVAIVAVPAAGMGTTLPLLARFIHGERPATASRLLARLYAVNTAGGAFGSLVSAYVLIPSLGLGVTMRVCALVSVLIGIAAMVVASKVKKTATPFGSAPAASNEKSEAQEVSEGLQFKTALALGLLSGLLVFGCEVVFVHLLALVIGTSVYAFGLMLAIFLVCLSMGTPVATSLERRFGERALSVSLAYAAIALSLSLLVWDHLPSLFVALGPSVRTWHGREMVRAFAAFACIALPAILMGTTFPLVLRAVRAHSAAQDVGKITVANTVGSILGSVVIGFVVLPSVGSQGTLVLTACTYAACAAIAARSLPDLFRSRGYVVAAFGVLLALAMPKWNLARLTSGANVYFDEGVVPHGVLESIEEDVHGGVTTIVRGEDGQRTLLTNGKFQGNDSQELKPNRGFAHLPAAFAEKRDRALVIGLGTGTTTGVLSGYPFKQIDVAELSPSIVKAAKTTFAEVNRHVLDDKRTHVYLEDGRNMLLTGTTKYDAITIEVTSIWFAGAANLYNREFYELAKRRLSPGGVIQNWLQLHHTNKPIVASILASVRAAFPHVLVFLNGHQGHILASEEPLSVSRERLFELEEIPGVKEGLGNEHLIDYVRGVLMDEEGVDKFLRSVRIDMDEKDTDALISTDENLFLEYATPRGNVPGADDIGTTIGYLSQFRTRGLLLSHLEK